MHRVPRPPAPRIVQWATGAVGRAQLQAVIERPDLDLVGVRVYGSDKVGLDAGDLCGLGPTGVVATDDRETVIALDADVVLHAASKAQGPEANTDDIVALLESGASVITTTSYNHLPTFGAEVQERIAAACAAGGTRFHAAGENPGFMLERLAATASGLCQDIDRIVLLERTDVSGVSSPSMLFDLMNMGKDPSEVTAESRLFKGLDLAYCQALGAAADALGVALERIERSVETTTVDHDVKTAAGVIAAGTVVGQDMSWKGWWDGRVFLEIDERWVATKDLPQWGMTDGVRDPLIAVTIHGRPTLTLTFDPSLDPEVFEAHPHLAGMNGGHLMIAMSAVRAIPDVLAAPPGIVTAPVFAAWRPPAA